jgi:anthranilate/para-aminobenzoate synthase component II
VPPELVATAWTEDGEVMGVRHRCHPVEGVQFHPESVLTPEGPDLVANFLAVQPAFGAGSSRA